MRAEIANLNNCAVPFSSRAAANLCWYYIIYIFQPVSQIKKQMDTTIISDDKKSEDVTCKRTDVTLTDTFQCCAEDLFQCFINPGKLQYYKIILFLLSQVLFSGFCRYFFPAH